MNFMQLFLTNVTILGIQTHFKEGRTVRMLGNGRSTRPLPDPKEEPWAVGVINAPQSGQETSELWVPLHWRSFSSAVGNAARQKTGTSSRNRGPQFLGNKSLFYPLPKVHNLPENVLPNEFPRKQKITSKPLIFKTQPEATTEKFWLRRNAVRNK